VQVRDEENEVGDSGVFFDQRKWGDMLVVLVAIVGEVRDNPVVLAALVTV